MEEEITMTVDQIGTKAAADFAKERRMKSLVGNLSAELQKILSSCILTEQYPATTIAFQFTILELDSDIL